MKQFLTTYTQDYTEKERRPVRFPKRDDRKKPTHTVKYFEYLILDKDKPLEPPEEYYKDYYEKKFKEQYIESDARYFCKPLDAEMLKKYLALQALTTYQSDYCRLSKQKSKSTGAVKLDKDTELPYTTYRSGYRNPVTVNRNASIRIPKIVPPTTMGTEKKLFNKLNVKTGKSEYSTVIGELGGVIVRDQIYGKIIHPKCEELLGDP